MQFFPNNKAAFSKEITLESYFSKNDSLVVQYNVFQTDLTLKVINFIIKNMILMTILSKMSTLSMYAPHKYFMITIFSTSIRISIIYQSDLQNLVSRIPSRYIDFIIESQSVLAYFKMQLIPGTFYVPGMGYKLGHRTIQSSIKIFLLKYSLKFI